MLRILLMVAAVGLVSVSVVAVSIRVQSSPSSRPVARQYGVPAAAFSSPLPWPYNLASTSLPANSPDRDPITGEPRLFYWGFGMR